MVRSVTVRRLGSPALWTTTSRPPISSHAWRARASAASVSERSTTHRRELGAVLPAAGEDLVEPIGAASHQPDRRAPLRQQRRESGPDPR